MPDIFEIKSDAVPAAAHVVSFRGHEGISSLYRFDVALIVKGDVEVDLDAATGTRATLTIHAGEDDKQVFHGVIAAIDLVHSWDGQSVYQLVLVPQMWLATLSHHSRVFVEKSSPDFIKEVLEASGLSSDDYTLRLNASYDPMLHVCQYQESDFQFVARWMEREGMYFYFEQGDECEKLIITDHLSSHGELREKGVRYIPLSGEDTTAQEALNSFRSRRNMLPAEVRLSDYDYLNPSLSLASTGAVDGAGQIAVYGENFRLEGDGDRLAAVRAERHLATRRVFQGTGRVFNLRAGYKFDVVEHPQSAMNAGYLCTRLEHRGNGQAASSQVKKLLGIDFEGVYAVDVTAISADVQYRHPRSTETPRIHGVIHAMVDGPADSNYAQLDEHGRYKVRLFLDESGLSDGKASTWIRMLQFHAGGTEGVHFPLRKGTEVMIIFLGGDPDRPMICGAVPNPQKPSPVTSSNHTWNVLATGGGNYMAIQDEADKQYIDLYSPSKNTYLHLGEVHDDYLDNHTHNIVLNTEGNCLFNIGGDQDIEVGGDLTEHVAGDVSETYDNDQDSYVGGDQTLEVACDRDIEVGGDQTVEIGGDFDTEVGGDITLEGGGDYDTEITGDITFENGGDFDVEVGGDTTWETGGDYDIEGGGDITFENPGDFVIDTGGNFEGTVGGDWLCKIMGTKDEKVLGDCKWLKTGTFLGIDLSASTQLKLSADAILSIGAKAEIAISVEAALKMSLALEATMGVKIACDMAASVNIEAGGSIKTKTAEMVGRGIILMDNTAGLRMLSQSLVLVA